MVRIVFATAVLGVALAAVPFAQTRGRNATRGCDDFGGSDRASACEVREESIPTGAVNPLDVDAGRNGGIRVRGWDRPDVHMRARVSASADTDAEARSLLSAIRIVTSAGTIRAEGPDASGRNAGWAVGFELDVPRTAILTLTAHNGGISIEEFQGTAKFTTVNGGVSLRNVGGDIRGNTTNGGVTVDLAGDRWDGAGLDVETHNGGIRMTLPEHFSAKLETSTTHGRVNVDFPMTVQGDSIGRQLTTTLGLGGATLRAVTTNGGVSIRRRS
jgi:putative adhesin